MGWQIPETAAGGFFGASESSESAYLRPGVVAQMVGAAVADRVARKLAGEMGPETGADAGPDADAEAAAILGEGWEEILSPMVDPVLAAVQAAASYDDAVAAMTRALSAMDTAALEDAVARGSLISRAEAMKP